MKFYIALFLFSILHPRCIAQSGYAFNPSKSVSAPVSLNETNEIKITILNTGNSKLALSWVRISNTLPSSWQYSMCDNVFCYGGVPTGVKMMDSIVVGGQGFLNLGVEPGNNPGSGQVKLYLYRNGFPNAGDTLTWNITAQAVGVEEIFENSGIMIYPNPANNLLNINFTLPFNHNTRTAYITDVLGKRLRSVELSGRENSIDLSGLADGYYNLVIETPDRTLFKRIIKAN